MPLDLTEFRRYLRIDKLALDDEFIQQPELFGKVADAMADAIDARDTLKERLTTVDAELDGAYRKKVKGTEAQIKNLVQTDPQHEEAFRKWLDAKTFASKLEGLKSSYDQRKDMLKGLAQLHASGYFGQNFVRDAAADRMVYDQTRSKLADARQRRRD